MHPGRHRLTKPVARWIAERGYKLKPGVGFECRWDDKVIAYMPGVAPQTMLRGLLHECGHMLVGETLARNPEGVRFKRGYPSERVLKQRPNISAADVMHEEIEAWHRGYDLAQRLGVALDEPAFWKDYGFCIKRYCRRLLQRKV